MEGRHKAIEDVIHQHLISGVNIGDSNMHLSHLFYADDVVMLTEWNQSEMVNIIRVLDEFYQVSGLKINIQKSNV